MDAPSSEPLRTWIEPADLRAEASGLTAAKVTLHRLPPRRAVMVAALFPRSAFGSVDKAVVRKGDGRAAITAREDRIVGASSGRRAGWITDHQWLLIAALLAAEVGAMLLLVRAGREGGEPSGLEALSSPPDGAPAAVAAYLATMTTAHSTLVLPTLLALVRAGFYEASIEPAAEGSRDLVLAISGGRPSTAGLPSAEAAVLAYFDSVIADEPLGLSRLTDRLPADDSPAYDAWKDLSTLLGRSGREHVTWGRDLRPLRWALIGVTLAGLVAIDVLSGERGWSEWRLWVAVPLVLAVGAVPSAEMLRHLQPESLVRHRAWLAFAEWTRRPGLARPPARRQPADWERVVQLALAFGTLEELARSGLLPVAGAGEGSWWAGLADEPLRFLADSKLGCTFEDGVTYHVIPNSD